MPHPVASVMPLSFVVQAAKHVHAEIAFRTHISFATMLILHSSDILELSKLDIRDCV